jgi:hypothetical protein
MAKAPFQDPDLHTPAHDAIMMWLEENARSIVDGLFGINAEFDAARGSVEAKIAETSMPVRMFGDAEALISVRQPAVRVDTSWEVPTRFSGGTRYIDMVVSATWRSLQCTCGEEFKEWEWKYEDIGAVVDARRSDLAREGWMPYETSYLEETARRETLSVNHMDRHEVVACEVKPVIRSAGELIRQLRQYENYVHRGSRYENPAKVAVVSPDDRFRAIIEKQGFIFIKAPQPEYGPQGGLF